MAPKMLRKVAKASGSRPTASAEQVSGIIGYFIITIFFTLIIVELLN